MVSGWQAAGSDPRRFPLARVGIAVAYFPLMCPVLCHAAKLGKKVSGAKVAVPGGHLNGRMAKDATEVV